MDVEIKVKGSVICYLKDALWHIVFITDEKHLAKFSTNGGASDNDLRCAGLDRNIFLYFNGAEKQDKPKGDNFDDILNIAGKDMHGRGRGFNSQFEISRKSGKKTEVIQMLIPAAQLDCDELTKDKYYVQELGVDPDRRPIGRRVAACIKITMKLKDRVMTMITTDGKGSKIIPLSSVSSPLKLSFDNDCGEDCKMENDFQLYYDWLVEKSHPTRRFIAGKDSEIKGRQGNCDPISVDPPPLVGI